MQTALASLGGVCRGRRVIVVGPSPGVRLPVARPGDVVYGVNGGLGCVTDRPVDLWQVNGRQDRSSLRIQPTEMRKAWLDQGRNRSLAGLVVFHRDQEGFGTVKELTSRGCRADMTIDIQRKWRPAILTAIGIDHPTLPQTLHPSAGVFGLCLTLLAGAETVVACGFSFQTGYQYLPDHELTTAPKRSGHADGDAAVLRVLVARHGDRVQTTSPAYLEAGVAPVADLVEA